ncbi:MAG: hypothetical protein AAGA62_16360, partial [Bacteroidota bacterium]
AYATLRKTVRIEYVTEADEATVVDAKIVNLYTSNKEEFMVLDNKQEIRLDRLRSVDGKVVPLAC